MINPMDLSGKRYIVTGASSGIGRQTCVTLRELGATVFVVARNVERLNETVVLCESAKFCGGGLQKPIPVI